MRHPSAALLGMLVLMAGLAPVVQGPRAQQKETTPAPPSDTAQQPEPAPQPATPQAEKPSKAIVIPAAERNRTNPVPAVPEAIESGHNLFMSQCSMCHGAKGDGKGNLAQSLKLKIPDFTDPREQARRTDGELFYILTHGHAEMPPEKRLADQQKWEMIRFIRTLNRAAAPKP